MDQSTSVMHSEMKKYLEKIIKSIGVEDYTLTIQPGTKKGDNYLGIIAEVLVDGKKNGEGVKFRWIAKCASQNTNFREVVRIESAFEREIYVYEELFPIFTKFQADRRVQDPFKSFPPFIGSNFKPYQEVVIMEDMKEMGFVMKNRKEPLDLEHARLIMTAYGKLHAVSYAIKDQDPELFESLKKKTVENIFSFMSEEYFAKQEEVNSNKILSMLDPVEHSWHKLVFIKYREKSFRIIMDTIKKSYQSQYSVICHGDNWINNLLFKYENKQPTEVCLLDFQLVRYGSPAFDLSFLIFACTEKAFRDKYYDELISSYYQTLYTCVTNLGSDPEKLLPFSVLKKELKRFSVLGFFLAQLLLHLMVSDQDEVPDIDKVMTEEEIVNEFLYDSKNEKHFKRRIHDMLIDFVEKGYFDFIDEEYSN